MYSQLQIGNLTTKIDHCPFVMQMSTFYLAVSVKPLHWRTEPRRKQNRVQVAKDMGKKRNVLGLYSEMMLKAVDYIYSV